MRAPEPSSMDRRAAWSLVVFLVVLAVVHGVLAWASPLLADDWGHRVWQANHARDSTGDHLIGFVGSHFRLGSALGYTLARVPLVHTVLTPVMMVALLIGVFVIATRRLPRPGAWSDVLAIALLSAMLWIAQPRAGLVLFYRQFAAEHLYGAAIAVWVVAAYRGRWRLSGWQQALVVLGALVVGTASRQLALVTLIGTIWLVTRTERPARARWMIAGVIAMALGAIVSLLDTPVASVNVFKRGFEYALRTLNMPINEGGELLSLVALLVLVRLVLDRLVAHREIPEVPAAGATLRWVGLWFVFCVLALFGPRYSEATLVPATLTLCIAALPYVLWLATSRSMRVVVASIAIGVHLVAWTSGLQTLLPLHDEFERRMHILERTPSGEVATIRPYSQARPGFWFFGEDWAGAAPRQITAIKLFGLADIEYAPGFRALEENPRLTTRLDVEGVSDAELAAARPPRVWATELTIARRQFVEFLDRIQLSTGKDVSARLVVADLSFPEARGRPLLAAWHDRADTVAPRITRMSPDAMSRLLVRVEPELARRFEVVFIVDDGHGIPVRYERGGYRVQAMTARLFAVVGCEAQRCLVIDAFVPRF